MPSSCVVGGCRHRVGNPSKIPKRPFLILHGAPTDKARRRKWDTRINRELGRVCSSVMEKYYVCSDHFHDTDYELSDMTRIQLMGYKGRMKLRLKAGAVPNTHPKWDELQLFINGRVQPEESTVTRKVCPNLRDPDRRDQFNCSKDVSARRTSIHGF